MNYCNENPTIDLNQNLIDFAHCARLVNLFFKNPSNLRDQEKDFLSQCFPGFKKMMSDPKYSGFINPDEEKLDSIQTLLYRSAKTFILQNFDLIWAGTVFNFLHWMNIQETKKDELF